MNRIRMKQLSNIELRKRRKNARLLMAFLKGGLIVLIVCMMIESIWSIDKWDLPNILFIGGLNIMFAIFLKETIKGNYHWHYCFIGVGLILFTNGDGDYLDGLERDFNYFGLLAGLFAIAIWFANKKLRTLSENSKQ